MNISTPNGAASNGRASHSDLLAAKVAGMPSTAAASASAITPTKANTPPVPPNTPPRPVVRVKKPVPPAPPRAAAPSAAGKVVLPGDSALKPKPAPPTAATTTGGGTTGGTTGRAAGIPAKPPISNPELPPAGPESEGASPTCPYFMAGVIGFEGLPENLQIVIEALVNPIYEELVAGEVDPLKKSTGTTISCEQAFESFVQPQLMEAFLTGDTAEVARLERLLDATVKRKHKSIDILLRLRAQDARRRDQGPPWRPK